MPGPGPHMMYAMGSGLALTTITNGRFSPHHTLTYTINAFFGPDIGSFSEWLGSLLGGPADTMGSAVADLIHHPLYYIFILGLPLSFLYSRISAFLVHRHLLDSVSRVPLSKMQCFFLISAGSFAHFFLDHLFEENGKTLTYTWILSTGWWQGRAPVNPDAVIVVCFLCTCLIGGFFLPQQSKCLKFNKEKVIPVNATYAVYNLFILLMVCNSDILDQSTSSSSWRRG